MKVVITGASGFVGGKLMQEFSPHHDVIGTYASRKGPGLLKLDITNKRQVASVIAKHKPSLLIHAAALTDVDLCERDQELAYKVNIQGTENLLDAYRGNIVYLSTGYVFDGKERIYTEEHRPRPISYYGYTKSESERLIQNSGNDHIIARFDVPYGYVRGHTKFVNWALDRMVAGKTVKAVHDQVRSPTLVDDISRTLLHLASADARGVFHVAGTQHLTSYEMARKIAEHFSLPKRLVRPVKASHFDWDAQRPRNLPLSTDKLRSLGMKTSSFDQGLRVLKKQMGDNE
jgi:dTDP-4-dehydrorhamnose reductase